MYLPQSEIGEPLHHLCDHVHLSSDQLGDAPGLGRAWGQGYSQVVRGAGLQRADQGLLSGEGTRSACFPLIFISY